MVMLSEADVKFHAGVLLDAALHYARRGWSIIAVIGKRAARLWRPFQEQPADKATLRRMFAKPDVTGLAVITGRVSAGLAIRDFDDERAYHGWASAYPEAAAQLPTVRTARGFHVYGRLDEELFSDLGDGELRADSKHYILLPPSVHPDGTVYTWTVPLPPIGAILPLLPESLTQCQPKQFQDNPTQNNPLHALAFTLEKVIAGFLPPGPGHRNRCIFNLARALKGVMPDATPDQLRDVLRQWHHQALPHIVTKEFSESWTDFVVAWGAVKHPAGQTFRAAVAAADSVALRGVAARYDGNLRRLAALCVALQAQSGASSFFLGCREAGKFLGIDKSQAWRLLKTLQFDGVLKLVNRGSKKTGKASEWQVDLVQGGPQ